MSEHTAIEWTESTWNPWHGCTKVSAGCDHCYMFREKRQYGQDPELVVRSKTKFGEPLKWKEPRVIFTCSWSDWFHVAADPWRDEAWDIIRRTPQHTYQILTKRPGRIARHLPSDWGDGYPNVWLGTSIEDENALHRAGQLAAVPARLRFLSCEPLIGPLSFRWAKWHALSRVHNTDHLDGLRQYFHWLIAGGESGPGARLCDVDWLRMLRDQCAEAGVPFFLKQLGGWPNKRGGDDAVLDGRRWVEMPERAA